MLKHSLDIVYNTVRIRKRLFKQLKAISKERKGPIWKKGKQNRQFKNQTSTISDLFSRYINNFSFFVFFP